MESLQSIKQRLKSVKNISQITKAMELVASTKMRKSQEVALASRPYVYIALELLAQLSRSGLTTIPPLLEKRPIKRTAIILVASDKGLTGSFNSAVFRTFETYMKSHASSLNLSSFAFIAVGNKSLHFFERKQYAIETSFTKFGDITMEKDIRPLASLILEGYLNHAWDKVVVFSTNFKSALLQQVVMREILPVTFEQLRKTAEEIIPQTGRFAEEFGEKGFPFFDTEEVTLTHNKKEREYLIEPSPEEALRVLIPHLVIMQIYHIILEANASEHAARRMAMKSASDNAGEILDALTIDYNKSRQAGITRELTEITAGAEAL